MSERKNLLQWAYYREQTRPDQVWLTQPLGGGRDEVKTYTHRQFMNEARRMANHLGKMGFPPRSHIGVCSKNCAHWIMADLAIWMAGHVSVPVFPVLTRETCQYVVEHSEARLLFVGKLDPVWEEMKKAVPESLPKIAFPLAPDNDHAGWDDIVASTEPLKDPVDRSPEELATIIYTSGSTGVPKGVMHDFGTLLAACVGLDRIIHGCETDRYLSYLPVAHAMERWTGECCPIYGGYQVFFVDSLDTFVRDLRRARPTLFLSVPRLWLKFQLGVFEKLPPEKLQRLFKIPILNRIVKKKILKQLGLDQVRFAGSGSAPIPEELITWYRELGLELLEGYGMTENFNYSHLTKPGQVRPGYIGTPYDGVDCRLSEQGEVLVKGPGSMMGYFKMPEQTRESFTDDGYLRTGDRGEIDEMGRLKITGRTKELFKTSKGKYVAPAPIENRILNHPRIELCCVSGAGFPQPHALLQLSEQARAVADAGERDRIAAELDLHLKEVNRNLDAHEKLQFLCVVADSWTPENGFLTPTLKVRRAIIEKTYSPFSQKWYESDRRVIWQA